MSRILTYGIGNQTGLEYSVLSNIIPVNGRSFATINQIRKERLGHATRRADRATTLRNIKVLISKVEP